MAWGESEQTQVIVRGETIGVSANEDLTAKIKEIAKDHGLKVFRVYLDGEEISSPDDAPETFEGIKEVKIEPQDIAA